MNKRKNIAVLCFMLFSTLNLLSQNNNKNEGADNKSKFKHLDSLVNLYETKGIDFYHYAKYDSAVIRFEKALNLIDSLLARRKQNSDFINSIVTQCSIASCYCKRKAYYNCYKSLPDDNGAWLAEIPQSKGGYIGNRLLAFVQLTWLDYRTALKQHDYIVLVAAASIGNLRTNEFSKSDTLIYPYALQDYTLSSIYNKIGMVLKITPTVKLSNTYISSDIYNAIGDFYRAKGDTTNSKIYYGYAKKYHDE